jgi:Protein of unknown function (DUF3160)/YARHG domain
MNSSKKFLLSFTVILFIFSCANESEKKASTANLADTSRVSTPKLINTESILKIDFQQDLSKASLQELRLLKNALYARQGYCFMQADLRGYFSGYMKGYDSIMEARFWAEDEATEEKPNTFPQISFSAEENTFMKKVDDAITERKKQNYVSPNGNGLANVENIVNLFQFKSLSPDFMTLLHKNNFAIVPADNTQLFHVYEKNDYGQIPNFVTTDLYLQLYHMYFSYVLKSLEQDKFIPIVTELSEGMYTASMKTAATTTDAKVKSVAEFTATFYAIPYYILTGKKKIIPANFQQSFEEELKHIDAETDETSIFLEYKQTTFPYSLFKPRGHYTRNEQLKKYFKSMMWLQTASFCRETPEQLKRTTFMAYLLSQGKSATNKPLIELYNGIYEPIVFLIGEPDNLSVNDIASYYKEQNLTDITTIFSVSVQQKIDAQLKEVSKTRNKIKPKVQISCPDKINFMPQRYLFDNEILQTLVDVKPNANRPYPKGLDIFAVLGNQSAETILMNEYEEEKNWKAYPKELKTLKNKFENYNEWDKSVYNKWMQSLYNMQKVEPTYPSFMKTETWAKKNLNTSLASWADLKHDAILYAEQPTGAECGGGGPPPPYTVGYVEPNVNFWKNMLALLTLTENVLKKNNLLSEDIASKTNQLKESNLFLLTASEKELKKQKMTEQEYRTIEAIGASIEYLTLAVIEPGKDFQSWNDVQGPDKSVAVVADVYTRNIPYCQKNGILHEAVGNVNELYVVVEIDGYLYLTKGATFSYYEFVQPMVRLTDEEWQKMLESKKALPTIPQWMKEIILQSKDIPASDEKIFYSAGC